MTYFTTALTNGQKNKLRNAGGTTSRQYACDQLVFLCPNEDVFHARVNGAITGAPFAAIAYDTVTLGATADIKIGQRIIISPTNNKRDLNAITCRVRATPTGTTSGNIPINEISQDIANDSYIFVVNDYPLMDRLARPDPANPGTAQFKDYSLTYEALPPLVAGIQMVYVQKVDPDTGVATFSLDASDSFGTDDSIYGLPIASWLYEFDDPAAVNVTGGGTTQADIEFEIEEGFQWGHLTIEDDNGTLTTFHFQIHAWGDTYTPVLGFEGANITDDVQNGHGVSVIAFSEVSDVLDNTWMTIVRQPEYYNGVEGQLITGDAYYVEFVGFLSQETSTGSSDELFSFVSDTSFEVTGIGQRLAQIEMQAIGMRNNDTPNEWDEIDQLMPWRAIVHIWARHSTASTLIPLVFTSDVLNTSYFYPYFATPLGGNLLSSINYILQSINAALEFWPNGTVEGVRDIRYATTLARNSYLTLFDITTQDFQSISITRRHIPPVGKIYAEGAYFNAVSSTVQALKAIAPGTAQQIGTDTPTLGQQILTEAGSQAEAQSELNYRAGNFNAISSDDGNALTIETFGGYAPVFYASRNVLYTITYSDPSRGIEYDTSTKWMCVSIQTQHSNERGSRTCTITFVRLIPYAAPGDTIPQIPQGDFTPAIPDLAPFPAFGTEFPEFTYPLAGLPLSEINPLALQPPNGQVAKKDGSTLLIKSDTQAYLLQNAIIATTPPSYEVTPPDLGSFEIQQVIFDPLNTGSSKPTANRYGYILDSDGTDSHVRRAENIFARPPSWLKGDDITGLYNVLRGTNVDGGLMIYAPSTTETTDTVIANGNSDVPGTATGVMVNIGDSITFSATGTWCNALGSCWDADGSGAIAGGTFVAPGLISFSLIGRIGTSGSWFQIGVGTTVPSPSSGEIYLIMNDVPGQFSDNSGSLSVDIDYPGGSAVVRYSPDRGNTWGSEVAVGTSPGSAGGFDVSRASGTSYAACLGKVRKATTLGGAYSDFVSFSGAMPRAVCIPYFRIGAYPTAKQTTDSDPDFYAALDQNDSGGHAVYKVTGAGSKTGITPTAGFYVEVANAITASYGDEIAIIGVVSGDRRLYRSVNAGGAWTLEASSLPADTQFIRTRRGDNRRAKLGSGYGQGFLIRGATMSYTVDWFNTLAARNLPITAQGFDVLG